MTKEYPDIMKDIISELCENTLSELHQTDPLIRTHVAHLARLSQSFQIAVKGLSPYRRRVIEMYQDERSHLEIMYHDHLYVQGFKDCVKLLRFLGLFH